MLDTSRGKSVYLIIRSLTCEVLCVLRQHRRSPSGRGVEMGGMQEGMTRKRGAGRMRLFVASVHNSFLPWPAPHIAALSAWHFCHDIITILSSRFPSPFVYIGWGIGDIRVYQVINKSKPRSHIAGAEVQIDTPVTLLELRICRFRGD